MRRHHIVLLAMVVTSPALAGNPLEGFGGGQKPYLEPDGYYQVLLPGGFDCTQRESMLGPRKAQRTERSLECQGTRGAEASLVFRVRSVPRSATAALVALNDTERVEKHQEHFKELERRKLQMSGLDGVMIRYRYNQLGHLRLPLQVVALYAVANGTLFEIRYQSREDQLPRYQEDLEQVFASFKPAELDDAGKPIIRLQEAPKVNNRVRTDDDFVEKQLRKKNAYGEGSGRF